MAFAVELAAVRIFSWDAVDTGIRKAHKQASDTEAMRGRQAGIDPCVCVCVFIKLYITAQSGPVILVILCHSH